MHLSLSELKLNRTSQRSEKNVLEENYEKLKKVWDYFKFALSSFFEYYLNIMYNNIIELDDNEFLCVYN